MAFCPGHGDGTTPNTCRVTSCPRLVFPSAAPPPCLGLGCEELQNLPCGEQLWRTLPKSTSCRGASSGQGSVRAARLPTTPLSSGTAALTPQKIHLGWGYPEPANVFSCPSSDTDQPWDKPPALWGAPSPVGSCRVSPRLPDLLTFIPPPSGLQAGQVPSKLPSSSLCCTLIPSGTGKSRLWLLFFSIFYLKAV